MDDLLFALKAIKDSNIETQSKIKLIDMLRGLCTVANEMSCLKHAGVERWSSYENALRPKNFFTVSHAEASWYIEDACQDFIRAIESGGQTDGSG